MDDQLQPSFGYYNMPPPMHPITNHNPSTVQHYHLFNSHPLIYNVAHHVPPTYMQNNRNIVQFYQPENIMPSAEVQVPNSRKYRIPICDPFTKKEIDLSSMKPQQQSIAFSSTRITPRSLLTTQSNCELDNNQVSSTIAIIDSQATINPKLASQVPILGKSRIRICDPFTKKEIDLSSITPQRESIVVSSTQNNATNLNICVKQSPLITQSNCEADNNEVSSTIPFIDSQKSINPDLASPPETLATNLSPYVNNVCIVLPAPKPILVNTAGNNVETMKCQTSSRKVVTFAENTKAPVETELIGNNSHLQSASDQSTTVIQVLTPQSSSITEGTEYPSHLAPVKSHFANDEPLSSVLLSKYKRRNSSRGFTMFYGRAHYYQIRNAQQFFQSDYPLEYHNCFERFDQRPPQKAWRHTNYRNNWRNVQSFNRNFLIQKPPPRFSRQGTIQHTHYYYEQQQQLLYEHKKTRPYNNHDNRKDDHMKKDHYQNLNEISITSEEIRQHFRNQIKENLMRLRQNRPKILSDEYELDYDDDYQMWEKDDDLHRSGNDKTPIETISGLKKFASSPGFLMKSIWDNEKFKKIEMMNNNLSDEHTPSNKIDIQLNVDAIDINQEEM